MRAEPRRAEGRFDAADGTALRWIGRQPAGDTRAAILIVHGLADHAERYTVFADELARAAIATYAFDLRGHGESPGPRGHAPAFRTLLDDLEAFLRLVAERVGERPLFLFGHSMGGLIALRFVQAAGHGLAGVILSSPWLATATPVPAWKRIPAMLLERVLPAVPVPAGIDAADISDDPAAVRAYREDAKVHGRISPRLFREPERAAAAALAEQRLHVPAALFLVPGDDRIVSPEATRRFAARIAGAAVAVHEWAPAGHELLNSTKRAQVIGVIREWVVEHAGA